MALQFMYGLASKNHLDEVAKTICKIKDNKPQQKIYYLIPNHIKFQSEIKLLQKIRDLKSPTSSTFATKDIQILSISRLAWFFLRDSSIYQYPRLTPSSSSMLLYKIILEHQDELILFKNIENQTGLLSEINQQITELKRGNISPDDLSAINDQLVQKQEVNVDMTAKVHDLSIIYAAYNDEIQSRFVDNSAIMQALIDQVSQDKLDNTTFIISGFSNFSAEELQLFKTLLMAKGQVLIDLVMDKYPLNNDLRENSLFFENEKLVFKLNKWSQENSINILTPIEVQNDLGNQALKALEKYWIASNEGIKSSTAKLSSGSINIVKANNLFEELEQVAIKIRQKMVKDKTLRFSDFLILTRRINNYNSILKPIFQRYEIPIFSDLQVKMTNHPLFELLDAIFAVKANNYRYDDVMTLLKTGLLYPSDSTEVDFLNKVDITENYIIREGIYGYRWTQKSPWKYQRVLGSDQQLTDEEKQTTEVINEVKNYVTGLIEPLFDDLSVCQNGLAIVQTLYEFLIQNQVDQHLITWRDKWIAAGDLQRGSQPEQTWQTFLQILDEFVDILGDSKIEPDTFIKLIDVGFQGAEYAQIPSTLDQVLISELGMVQLNDHKFTFIIGANDKVMPQSQHDTGFLSDNIKTGISEYFTDNQFLSLSLASQMKQEPYLNYLNFMTANQELTFSYAKQDNNENEYSLSPYVVRIQNYFNIPMQEALKLSDEAEVVVGSKRSTLSHLIQVAKDAKKQKQVLNAQWQFVYKILAKSNYGYLTNQLLESLEYKNIPEKLQPQIITDLYGDTIYASVSKLEKFYQNEYEYFLQYGLKLNERKTNELTPADTGQYFHAGMDYLVKILNQTAIDFKNITSEQISNLTKQVLDKLQKDVQFSQFQQSARYHYLQKQLNQTIKTVIYNLFKQLARTEMKPVKSEQIFGQIGAQSGLPALSFNLNDGKKINVRGKIDRIDEMKVGSQSYLGVIDYKSSDHKFDFTDAYYGLALQMLLYLDVLKHNKRQLNLNSEAKLSSALYMMFKDPLVKLSDLTNGQWDNAAEDLFKNFKLKGLMVNDGDLLKEIDKTIDENPNSMIYPIKFNKSGDLSKASQKSMLTENELNLLINHAEAKVKEAGNRIFSGELKLNPVQWENKQTALDNSPFKAIMQFDAMLPENRYHLLKSLSKDEVLEDIEEDED